MTKPIYTVDYHRRRHANDEAWIWDYVIVDAIGEVVAGGHGHPSKPMARTAAHAKIEARGGKVKT